MRTAAIDEIQRAPDLLLAIKQAIDKSDERGQFLITGSANVLASRAVADALPGRVEYLNLWPLSQGEIEQRKETFIDRLLAGAPPRLSGETAGRRAHAERVVRGGFLTLSGAATSSVAAISSPMRGLSSVAISLR